MDQGKVPISLPQLDDPAEDKNFRRHVIALTSKLVKAMDEYLISVSELPEEDRLNPYSVGAACYALSYIAGLELNEAARKQVSQALVATLLLNDSDDLLKLATIPTDVPN